VNQTFSLWGILKQAMGKDLSRVSMPANINQPLGILQKMVEDFEYLDLLYRAIDDFGPGVDRMAALAGLVASSYSSWFPRAQKPFAPTLGETYDWRSPDGRVRVVCEQVSYADPPVAAFRAEGVTPGGVPFEIDGEGAGVSKFWGKYVQVLVQGGLHMRLPRTNETFSWSKASMHVHNVVSGRVWIDMVGEFQVVAHESGERADLKLLKGAKPEPGKPERRGFVQGARWRTGSRSGRARRRCGWRTGTARWRRRGRNERRSTSPRGSPRETPRGTTSRGGRSGSTSTFSSTA
jgi:hypothetical protein